MSKKDPQVDLYIYNAAIEWMSKGKSHNWKYVKK